MATFTPIGDALRDAAKGNLGKQAETAVVIEAAEAVLLELFGPEKSVHAKPLYLKNRTLTVTCSSSVMAQEIRLHQTEIVEKINKKTGTNEVDRIRYLA